MLLLGRAHVAMVAPMLAAAALEGRIVYRALGARQGDIYAMDVDGRNHAHLGDAPRDG